MTKKFEGHGFQQFSLQMNCPLKVQESRKIVRAVHDLPVYQHSQSSPDSKNRIRLAALVSRQIIKGSQYFDFPGIRPFT